MQDTARKIPTHKALGPMLGASARVFARAPIFFLALSAIQMLPHPVFGLFGAPRSTYASYVPVAVAQVLLDLVQAAMLDRAARLLEDRKPPLGATLGPGLRRAAPILAVSLIQVAAFALGLALLVLPGLLVTAALFVAAPICLEGASPLASVKRSWVLTRGSRWRIVGAIVLVWLPYLIPVFAIGVYNGVSGRELPFQPYIVGAGAVVLSGYMTILSAVVYRALQPDAARDEIAAVFV